ncbi:hypothetical protein BOTBODRAFT_40041, partial [Botryobasidium botryosum FD-172 SS1]
AYWRGVWLKRDAAGGRSFWHTAGWDFGFVLHLLWIVVVARSGENNLQSKGMSEV